MKYEDFERMHIYKCFLPFVYILNWILMFVGPVYLPTFYQNYYLFCVLYLTCRTVFSCLWTQFGSRKAHQLLDNLQKQRQIQAKTSQNSVQKQRQNDQKRLIQHIFVLPNYNQEFEVLSMTIQRICSHFQAKRRFSVFLAMQDHQKNATNKAQKLINIYQDKLKHIGFTLHSLRKYQQRGKAANVSWCVQHLEELYLNPKKINQNQVMLTIIDADSWVPQQYIKEIQNYIQESKSPLHSAIFQPCQMFTRNNNQVPFIVRYYDVAHGLVHFSNLFSLFGISFPLSNYSLSYSLAKKIGFWDTCPDAIGQDFHTTIKAFWKTRGNVTTVPIFTPFNQLSIHTGGGFWKDVCKRFWQAQRHGRGCADAAYNIKNIIQNQVNLRTFFIAFQSLQITIFPAFLPWCLISINLFKIYSNHFNLQTNMNCEDVSYLFNICTLASIWMFIQYDSVCMRASQVYYKINHKNFLWTVLEWIYRLVSYHVVFFVCIFTITIPSVTIAVFRIVLGENVYETAQKKLDYKSSYTFIQK